MQVRVTQISITGSKPVAGMFESDSDMGALVAKDGGAAREVEPWQIIAS